MDSPSKKNNRMKVAVITAPRTIDLKLMDTPEPAADEFRIKLQGCGLCASDVPVWQGREWFSYPAEPGSPGHEGWGIVDKVGENVKTIHPGYRVAALCQNAYAEYDIVKENQVVELPESFNDKPFPGEPLACAMNIFRRSQIKKTDKVAIVGAGWLGLLLIQLAKSRDAEVFVVSRRSGSLEKARDFGADHAFSVDGDINIFEKIEELTKSELCDCVIEAAGKQETLDLAGTLTGVRGRLIIAGYHQDGNREVDMQLWNWRGIDVINAHEREPAVYIAGMREAVKFINQGILNPFPLYTHTFSLDEIQKAFETFDQKPNNFTKALITVE